MKFEITKSTNNQFFVRTVSDNGRVLQTSETFKRKSSAFNNILSLYQGLSSKAKIYIYDYTMKKKVVYHYLVSGIIYKAPRV